MDLTTEMADWSALNSVAERAIERYALPPRTTATLISQSENAVYRLDDPITGTRWALRIHRPNYHTRSAIASELAWLLDIAKHTDINVPRPVSGRDGKLIQNVTAGGGAMPLHAVLFHWETGVEPATTDVTGFEQLGRKAAHLHRHVQSWQRPAWFTRPTWNFDTTLGETPHWGHWRDGLGMTQDSVTAIAETVPVIARRLDRLGTGPEVFNLVHCDMRLANILDDGGTVKVIDFDDCGFSWLLYDCATTVSFFEDAPHVPDLIRAWARGYRHVGTLSAEEETEIETFVMLRRILLVAWIGSHSETGLARALGSAYTQSTIPLCERYLGRFGGACR